MARWRSVSSTTNPDEPSPSSTRLSSGRVSDPPPSEPPPTDPQRPTLCPRCGGEAQPRQRRSDRVNPFLSTPPPKPLVTCLDCGLDVALSDDESPWGKGP